MSLGEGVDQTNLRWYDHDIRMREGCTGYPKVVRQLKPNLSPIEQNWKRRAKRLAAKGNQKGSMITTGKAAKQAQNAGRSNLINKGGVKPQAVRAKHSEGGHATQQQATGHAKSHSSTPK